MRIHAQGTFTVKLTPQAADAGHAESAVGRMLIEKQFAGDLRATSKGQMLMAGTSVQGSAGYVAIEQVKGELLGRTGSFVLQHNGLMNRGTPQLAVVVVPDSGTDELTGLTGSLNIIISDGDHSYEADFALPGDPE